MSLEPWLSHRVPSTALLMEDALQGVAWTWNPSPISPRAAYLPHDRQATSVSHHPRARGRQAKLQMRADKWLWPLQAVSTFRQEALVQVQQAENTGVSIILTSVHSVGRGFRLEEVNQKDQKLSALPSACPY